MPFTAGERDESRCEGSLNIPDYWVTIMVFNTVSRASKFPTWESLEARAILGLNGRRQARSLSLISAMEFRGLLTLLGAEYLSTYP